MEREAIQGILDIIKDELSYFDYHNKNLTKKQEFTIQYINDLLDDLSKALDKKEDWKSPFLFT